jgi:drug/metabolite transporter (DMT)-like permease
MDKPPLQSLQSATTRNLILLFGVVLLWGGNWPAMKVGVSEISPLWFSTLRFGCGGLCLICLAALSGQLRWPQKTDWPIVITGALFQMAAFSAFVIIALLSLPVGRSVILAYSTPLWVAPASVPLLRERLSPLAAGGVCCGIAGLILLTGPWNVNWSDPIARNGIELLVSAAVFWAAYIIHVHARPLRTAPLSITVFQMAVATVVLGFAAYFAGPTPHLPLSNNALLSIAYVGPLGTAFCFWASWDLGQRLPATTVVRRIIGVPVAGLCFSTNPLYEGIDLMTFTGAILVLLGLFIVAIFDAPRKPTASTSISISSARSSRRTSTIFDAVMKRPI